MAVELTYFNMSGLGEPVRAMLSYGEITFIDKRVDKEEWATIKAETKFGKLPRLRIDGIELYQSRSICRYIATKLNLRPNDPKLAAQTDMLVDTLDDVRNRVVTPYYKPDSDQRTKDLAQVKETDLPKQLSMFEKNLESESAAFFVNNQVTWVDVMFFAYLLYFQDLLRVTAEELLSQFPRLLKIYSTIKGSRGIQNWLKSRPPSPNDLRTLFK